MTNTTIQARFAGSVSLAFFLLTHFAQADPALARIEIDQLKFVPMNVTVDAGTIIEWVNRDPVDHDVTSGKSITGRAARGKAQTEFPDGRFASGLMPHDGTFQTRLDQPGTYPYYCGVHPFMVGTIVVREHVGSTDDDVLAKSQAAD